GGLVQAARGRRQATLDRGALGPERLAEAVQQRGGVARRATAEDVVGLIELERALVLLRGQDPAVGQRGVALRAGDDLGVASEIGGRRAPPRDRVAALRQRPRAAVGDVELDDRGAGLLVEPDIR